MRCKGGASKSEALGAAAAAAAAAIASMDRESDAAKEEKKASAPRETGIVCAYKQGEKYGFIKRFDFRSRMHLDKDMVLSIACHFTLV